MLFDKKFDLVVSIGEDCACTSYLRRFNLQKNSYPFDWLFGSSFLGRSKILTCDIANFIKKDDLEFSYEERSISCNAYYNHSTDITFNHDFKKDIPFDEAYIQVKQKYDRRINRLLKHIEKSENVLVVYIQTPNNKKELSREELLEGYNILKEKFGEKINLLYLYCDSTRNLANCIEVNLNKNVKCIKYDYGAHNVDFPFVVNKKMLLPIFNKLKISNKFITNINKLDLFTYKLKIFFTGEIWKNL